MADKTRQARQGLAPVPTGNILVLMRDNIRAATAAKRLEKACGMKVAVSKDYKGQTRTKALMHEAPIRFMDHLKAATICPHDGKHAKSMIQQLSEDGDVRFVRPEFHMFAANSYEERYRAWVREGLHLLIDGLPDGAYPDPPKREHPQSTTSTWGIGATLAETSSLTGAGVKLAVLDTGMALDHPDFAGRAITSKSFVPEEAVQDGNGHGTHCIGTSCGPLADGSRLRYGVAHEAEIFVGKVLSNEGSGQEAWILEGIEWAIEQGCDVISMSLGRGVEIGERPDPFYEAAGEVALENNALIVAAAGNDSARQFGAIAPVGAPANSQSIMAVAALDNALRVADFSCGGINPGGGEVDIAAPGVDIFSSFLLPETYKRLNGTSMACPHVAGIAALLAQSDDALRGQALWDALTATARDVGLSATDAGSGLVQAPQSALAQALTS